MTAMALAGICAVIVILWRSGAFLPRWIRWDEGSVPVRSGEYEILLSHKTVNVLYNGGSIWSSPRGVLVQTALSCDIDNDCEDELILLCWKIGRYGSYRPIWVEQDEEKWSQHIFVYEYYDGKVRPKWMSSYLGLDVAQMSAYGEEVPDHALLLTDPAGRSSCWMWDSWGFTKLDTADF